MLHANVYSIIATIQNTSEILHAQNICSNLNVTDSNSAGGEGEMFDGNRFDE